MGICECGKEYQTKTRFYIDGLENALVGLMPRGVHTAYFGTNQHTKAILSRLYRTSSLNSSTQKLNHFNQESEDFSDIKLVVAEGDYVALAKQFAQKNNFKLAIIGAQSISRISYLISGKGVEMFDISPDLVFLAPPTDVEVSFCQCVNVLLGLIDWDIAALIYSKQMCSSIFTKARQAIFNLIKVAKDFSKHSPVFINALIEAQLRISQIFNHFDTDILGCSSGIQSAAALNLLLINEQREPLDLSVNAFLLTPYILRLYAAFLNSRIEFCPPPNNNLRSKRLTAYLGLNAKAAHSLEFISRDKIELNDYRLSLYSKGLSANIYQTMRIFDDSYALMLRLFDDDGFFLRSYIDSSDISIALSLGADVIKSPTLLNYMKDKGVLDNCL